MIELLLKFTTILLAPSSSPINLVLTTSGPNTLLASWSPPPATDKNGVIIAYNLTLSVASQELDTVVRRIQLSGDRLSAMLPSLEEYTWYSLRLSAATTIGYGPETSTVARTAEAGMQFFHSLILLHFKLYIYI